MDILSPTPDKVYYMAQFTDFSALFSYFHKKHNNEGIGPMLFAELFKTLVNDTNKDWITEDYQKISNDGYYRIIAVLAFYRKKEFSAIDRNLFTRKPINNEELAKEINKLISN